MKKLLILGAGAYGQTIQDLAQQLGTYDKIAFLDDSRTGPNILGACGEYAMFADGETEFFPGFGNGEMRLHWLERLMEDGIAVPALVHPRAYVSPTVSMGPGSAILPMAVVNTHVKLEPGVIVNIGAMIDHDCVLEACVHVAPGAIVKGENRLPACMKVNAGTVIENREYPL